MRVCGLQFALLPHSHHHRSPQPCPLSVISVSASAPHRYREGCASRGSWGSWSRQQDRGCLEMMLSWVADPWRCKRLKACMARNTRRRCKGCYLNRENPFSKRTLWTPYCVQYRRIPFQLPFSDNVAVKIGHGLDHPLRFFAIVFFATGGGVCDRCCSKRGAVRVCSQRMEGYCRLLPTAFLNWDLARVCGVTREPGAAPSGILC